MCTCFSLRFYAVCGCCGDTPRRTADRRKRSWWARTIFLFVQVGLVQPFFSYSPFVQAELLPVVAGQWIFYCGCWLLEGRLKLSVMATSYLVIGLKDEQTPVWHQHVLRLRRDIPFGFCRGWRFTYAFEQYNSLKLRAPKRQFPFLRRHTV